MPARLPAAPPVLSGFSYVRPLGTGGFADVFLFEQNMPRRAVAVKVLLQNIVDEDLLRMFHTEADVMARLSAHPSILTIYEASVSADGRPYIVMEHCPSSMTNRYRREQLAVADVLHIGIKVASALETAHRAGLLHRDIKPSNILVTAFGAPVLSDFGIAASMTGREETEVFAMSVPWSAPEVVDERVSGSVSSEIWSLGATIYTLLAGRSPFERAGTTHNSRDELRNRIRRAVYTPVAREDVPAELEAVLRRSLSKDPRGRHHSAEAFATDLQQVQRALHLPVSPLEIAVDEWQIPPSTPDDPDDRTLARGPVRATVAHEGRRQRRAAAAAPAAADDTVRSSSTPGRQTGWLVASIVAGIVVVGGTVAAVVALLWGAA